MQAGLSLQENNTDQGEIIEWEYINAKKYLPWKNRIAQCCLLQLLLGLL